MSLRLALLALLTARPMTGFDLVRQFDDSVAYMWHAPHTQIYPALRKLEAEGLLLGEDVPRGEHGTKRVYAVTDSGRAAFARMMDEVEPPRRDRDPHRLKAAYLEWATPDSAREQLRVHRDHYREQLAVLGGRHEELVTRTAPLLAARLAAAPSGEHDAIVEFKAFAFRGMMDRARGEIAWAEEGLALLDRLATGRAAAD